MRTLDFWVSWNTRVARGDVSASTTTTPSTAKPMQTVQADLFTFQNILCFTAIDEFLKVLFTRQLKNKSAKSILLATLQLFSVYGCPEKLVVGSGREFRNKLFESTMAEIKVEILIITVGHPRSHGQIELQIESRNST